jgi:hypothetical protein
MAYVIDKETKLFWREYGKGLTKDAVEAYNYSDNAAHCLLRLFPAEVYISIYDVVTDVWKEHTWTPEPKGMPLRTKLMRDKELVWVAHEGLWMATDRQTLILGTLLAYNTPTPGRPDPMKEAV